jgi:hypothetical protein
MVFKFFGIFNVSKSTFKLMLASMKTLTNETGGNSKGL